MQISKLISVHYNCMLYHRAQHKHAHWTNNSNKLTPMKQQSETENSTQRQLNLMLFLFNLLVFYYCLLYLPTIPCLHFSHNSPRLHKHFHTILRLNLSVNIPCSIFTHRSVVWLSSTIKQILHLLLRECVQCHIMHRSTTKYMRTNVPFNTGVEWSAVKICRKP